jgi:hypothetical protein
MEWLEKPALVFKLLWVYQFTISLFSFSVAFFSKTKNFTACSAQQPYLGLSENTTFIPLLSVQAVHFKVKW